VLCCALATTQLALLHQVASFSPVASRYDHDGMCWLQQQRQQQRNLYHSCQYQLKLSSRKHSLLVSSFKRSIRLFIPPLSSEMNNGNDDTSATKSPHFIPPDTVSATATLPFIQTIQSLMPVILTLLASSVGIIPTRSLPASSATSVLVWVQKTCANISTLQTALTCLMITMGLSITRQQIDEALKLPLIVIVNAVLCFGIMPLLALGLTATPSVTPDLAVGTILLGCVRYVLYIPIFYL